MRKAGNVHCGRDLGELHYADLLLSAAAIGPPLTRACQRPVGETILEAIQATRCVVRTNTNLGIVLLLAPLAAVAPTGTQGFGVPHPWAWRCGLPSVLDKLSLDDSRLTFAAIRLACPGGLGDVPKEDVRDEPTLPLRAIMALAAERDLIARQYANGYRDILQVGVPWSKQCLTDGLRIEEAIVRTHLRFLAEYPDSLIARKFGPERAREVSVRAAAVLDDDSFAEFDSWLVAQRLNPGTSADLVAACLFVALRESIITGDGWRVVGGG